jgi:hypothetical protein
MPQGGFIEDKRLTLSPKLKNRADSVGVATVSSLLTSAKLVKSYFESGTFDDSSAIDSVLTPAAI